jgi:hypothetical protein
MKVVVIILTSLILILLLILGTIIVKIYNHYKKYEYYKNNKYINISNIYDELKTGDLILFKSNAIFYVNIFLTNTYYTHVGMIVKKNNILYISETNSNNTEYMPNYKTNCHSELLPLLIRIKHYPGNCFLMKLNKPLTNEKEILLLKYLDEKYPYPTSFQIFINYFIKNNKLRHCFQHVGHLLDKIGLTTNIMSNNIINICDAVENIFTKKINNGYQYDSPIKILYDI